MEKDFVVKMLIYVGVSEDRFVSRKVKNLYLCALCDATVQWNVINSDESDQ
jgi:hypothetical protein